MTDEKEFRRLTQAHADKYNRLYNMVNSTDGVEHIKLDAKGRDAMGIQLSDHKIRCAIEVKPGESLFW